MCRQLQIGPAWGWRPIRRFPKIRVNFEGSQIRTTLICRVFAEITTGFQDKCTQGWTGGSESQGVEQMEGL